MTRSTAGFALLAVFLVLVLFFPAGGAWFEVRALILYAAIIAAVVWLIRWMIHLGSDVAGIRRALEERNALDDQDRTVRPPARDVPPTTPPMEPPGQ